MNLRELTDKFNNTLAAMDKGMLPARVIQAVANPIPPTPANLSMQDLKALEAQRKQDLLQGTINMGKKVLAAFGLATLPVLSGGTLLDLALNMGAYMAARKSASDIMQKHFPSWANWIDSKTSSYPIINKIQTLSEWPQRTFLKELKDVYQDIGK
jgi:hypothetical protein